MEIIALFVVILLIFSIQAVVYQKQSFKMLDYSCRFSTQEAFAGDCIELIEEVANKKWLPLPWLKAEIKTSRWLIFADSQSLLTQDTRFVPSFFLLKSYQKITRSWKVTCAKRGVFSIRSVTLVSTDLIKGLLLSKSYSVDAEIMILPQPADLSALFISSRYLQGDYSVKNQLVPDPFYISGVREYLPGDPIKNVHWNATAKLSRIMVRKMEYTARKSLTVILNMQTREFEKESSIDPEKAEHAIQVAAALLEETLLNNTPVDFMSNCHISGERKETTETAQEFGREHILKIFRTLARFPCKSTQDFSFYLEKISGLSDSTDISLVTCYCCDYIWEFVRLKASQGKNVRIYLLDTQLPPDLPGDIELYLLNPPEEQPYE